MLSVDLQIDVFHGRWDFIKIYLFFGLYIDMRLNCNMLLAGASQTKEDAARY